MILGDYISIEEQERIERSYRELVIRYGIDDDNLDDIGVVTDRELTEEEEKMIKDYDYACLVEFVDNWAKTLEDIKFDDLFKDVAA